MSLETTRPDATVQAGNNTLAGAASRHAATNDDSDSSYIEWATNDPDNDPAILSLDEPSAVGGAVAKSFALRARLSLDASGAPRRLDWGLDIDSAEEGSGTLVVSWSTATTVTVASGSLGALPSSLEASFIGANTDDDTGIRLYELYFDYTYVAIPVVNVTAPTGTIDTNGPTVTWADTLDSAGGAQTKYEVKVFDDATYGGGGFDPDTSTPAVSTGEVASAAASRQVTLALADDTYRAYVRVAQTVNGSDHWSEWDYIEFTVDAVIPGTPLVDLTAQDDQGRIRIDIAETGTAGDTDRFEIERLTDGEYVPIRTLLGDGLVAEVGGGAAAYDHEAPNGVATTYRVRAVGDTSYGPTYSAWATASETWSSSDWWLKHPTDPDFNCPVVPDSVPEILRDARQGAFPILGARFPVVVDDTRGGPTGTITFRLDTAEEQAALVAILEECVTVLLQGRAVDNWTDRWVRFGDQASARIIDKSWIEPTYETLPWIEVAEPTDNLGEWLGEGS